MHRSGIEVDEELKGVFAAASLDASKGRIVVQLDVDSERFVSRGVEGSAGDAEANFAAAAASLSDKEAAYVLIKGDDGLWVLVNYVPDSALVKHKMLYASSRASLKEGLGGAQFGDDYFCSSREDLTLAQYRRTKEATNRSDILSDSERAKRAAHLESMVEQGVSGSGQRSSAVGAGGGLACDGSVGAHLQAYKAGQCDAVLLHVDMEKEVLLAEKSTAAFEDYGRRLDKENALYLLLRVRHAGGAGGKERTDDLFVYYCSDSAKPRVRMVSATFRNRVAAIVQENGVNISKSLEASDPGELEPAEVKKHLAAEAAASAAASDSGPSKFSKPKPAGQGARRLNAGTKFQAPGE